MSSHDSKSTTAYTIADLSREFAGEFTKEEIQQHLKGDRAVQPPSANVCPSVFVAGLCWATTDERLYDFFGTCGVVVSAEVFLDHCTGRSRGFGKVTFASLAAASKALSLCDAFLDGRPISVRPFDAIPPRRGGSDAPSFEVLVDSISWNTTEISLKNHFENCGEIVSCTVFYDRKTGQHKGIGKLVFASEAAALSATQRLETAPTFSLPVARDSYTGTVMALSGAYGVGFNAFPEMDGADIVLMSAEDGTFAVQDLCATCFSIPVTDVSTDTNVTSTGDYQFAKIEAEFTLLAAVGSTNAWSYAMQALVGGGGRYAPPALVPLRCDRPALDLVDGRARS
ncbi:28 kDa ribonucleoprotein, chloroplastic [Symbiodinium microadriaticum]|uniref:28 kDa ribonucleoprotein, chloroplastic n=1 Tax=Symbiodinium microadriaticum TaxID=2951 RepID=A0A1Q9DHU1_SYMMI|nr:28 kDa ribonucleoprotein, chloroplastic [Symbiodinium microadriaticum]